MLLTAEFGLKDTPLPPQQFLKSEVPMLLDNPRTIEISKQRGWEEGWATSLVWENLHSN